MSGWKNCIVVPVYNEANSAKKVIESIIAHKDTNTKLIIVQDGSNDGTREVLLDLQKEGFFKIHEILLIDHEENQGYGKALLSGFKEALKLPRRGITILF